MEERCARCATPPSGRSVNETEASSVSVSNDRLDRCLTRRIDAVSDMFD
jgi:hypothetical protein